MVSTSHLARQIPWSSIVGIRYNARKPSQSVRAHKKRVFTAVRNLISLFSPFAGSSPAPVPPLWPNVAPSWAMPPPAVEDRFQTLARLPPQNDLYVAEIPNGHAPPMLEPQQRILTSQHDWYGTDSNVDHVYPAIERQGLPAPNDPYYSAEAQQPFLPDDRVPPVQDPYYSYHRYNTMQEITPS
ncbi:hypothetical protein L1049_028195 [Liquidambar formosana]|uniref:Uncharacterized protein n=1 Tax=Liquidambar formosana TaxID=63359 RepID=A0AAP0RIK6_LIQFO